MMNTNEIPAARLKRSVPLMGRTDPGVAETMAIATTGSMIPTSAGVPDATEQARRRPEALR